MTSERVLINRTGKFASDNYIRLTPLTLIYMKY